MNLSPTLCNMAHMLALIKDDDGTVTTSLPPDPNEMELDLTDAIEMSVADELDHSS